MGGLGKHHPVCIPPTPSRLSAAFPQPSGTPSASGGAQPRGSDKEPGGVTTCRRARHRTHPALLPAWARGRSALCPLRTRSDPGRAPPARCRGRGVGSRLRAGRAARGEALPGRCGAVRLRAEVSRGWGAAEGLRAAAAWENGSLGSSATKIERAVRS